MKKFEELKNQDETKFGLAKTKMLFSDFLLQKLQNKLNFFSKESSQNKKLKIIKCVSEAKKEFKELKKYTQQLMCDLIFSKTLMEGEYTQDEKDKAYQKILNIQDNLNKHKIMDQVLHAEILDFKRYILKKYYFEEGSLRFFNIAKSFPIVYKDEQGIIQPIEKPIKRNLKSNTTFREPFINSKQRFMFKLDVLTEDLIAEVMRYGMRILHMTSDFDGTEGLCVEKENGVKHVLSPEQLNQILKKVQQEQTKNTKCKIKLVVLLIPKSENIAKVFSEIGVDHVVAFESCEQASKKDIRNNTLQKLQFNYIFAFQTEFYKNLAEHKTARQSFDKAKETVTDDFMRQVMSLPSDQYYLHSNLLLSEYEIISNIKIRPLFLQPDSSVDSDIIFTKNETLKGFVQNKHTRKCDQKVKDQYLNCSSQQGRLENFSFEENDYFGHMEDLYKIITWFTDKTHHNPIVHVRGVKSVGKTRFLKQVGKFFYQRGMFPFKISYIDLQKFCCLDSFKGLLDQMDADFKASQDYEIDQEKIKDLLSNEIQSSNRDILWLFDNIQTLSKQFLEQLEPKLHKICYHKNIKVLIASTDTIEDEQQKQNFDFKSFMIRESKIQSKIITQEIKLEKLTEHLAVHMFLDNVKREITEDELDPKTKSKGKVCQRIKFEPSFKECEKLPGKILEMAKQLRIKSDLNKEGGIRLSELREATQERNMRKKKQADQEERKQTYLQRNQFQLKKQVDRKSTYTSQNRMIFAQKDNASPKKDLKSTKLPPPLSNNKKSQSQVPVKSTLKKEAKVNFQQMAESNGNEGSIRNDNDKI